MDSLSDNALMLKVKAGDTGKLGLLYERYKKRLFGFFYQLTKEQKTSEDLVQNVFVRVLKYKHTYREDSQFMAWLFHIARNVNIDHHKKYRAKVQSVNVENISHELIDKENVYESIVAREDNKRLKLAINQLATDKREILLLSKFQELKYKEIGVVLGCSEVAARTKVHRAMNELKAIFNTLQN